MKAVTVAGRRTRVRLIRVSLPRARSCSGYALRMGWIVILLGCAVGAVGLREASSGQRVFPGGWGQRSARVDGQMRVLIGVAMVLEGGWSAAGFPAWWGLAFFGLMTLVGLWALYTGRLRFGGTRDADEVDPDAAERHRPPLG